jgi:hypothetical protein
LSAANAAKIGSAGRGDCLQISLLWLDLLLLLDYGPGFVVIRQPQPSLRHGSAHRPRARVRGVAMELVVEDGTDEP